MLLARLAYLAWLCPFSLIEDEAHYWEWSRRLDWSYYSKGPGVAFAIAASTRALGDSEFGVRVPAAIFAAIASIAVAGLARDVFRTARTGFLAAVLFTLIPLFQGTSLLMTIDMPYAAMWSLAAWAGWRAFRGGSLAAWAALGACLSLAFLFKYTVLLLIPGMLWYAWTSGRARPRAGTLQVSVCVLLALTGLIPVIMWNADRGWPTVHHLLGHLGVKGGDVAPTQGVGGWHYSPKWTLEFLGTQLGLVGPVLALVWLGFVQAKGTANAGRRYLLACASPILLFYFLISFVTEPEGNWALGGYRTFIPVAAFAVDRSWTSPGATRAWWRATLVYGLIAGLAIPRADLVAKIPFLAKAIPLSRLTGAREMAAHVQRLLDQLAADTQSGKPPFVVSQFYGRASQMAFYLPGHPTVYCSGSRMGGRKSQYDLWKETDLADPSLAGRSAVLIGDDGADWSWGFTEVVPLGKLDGDLKRNRIVATGSHYHLHADKPAPP